MSSKTFKILANPMMAMSMSALVFTAGCDENGAFQMPDLGFGSSAAADAGVTGDPAIQLVERDVEAPDVFSVSENGLWDGRPSLGGIWVAHPDVTDPERVIIRNQSNDEFVIGALFRRERENPGPSLQVSSDAAEALGMLAGSPTLLSVVALRREEGPAEPAAEPATETLTAPPSIEATTLDGAPVAEVPDVAPTPAPAPADPVASAAEIAIAAAEAAGVGASAPAAQTPAPVQVPAAQPASSLDKPFIQIGIFGVQANAERTADVLRRDGLLPTVKEETSRGRTFWRVIVGPATTSDDRAVVLAKAKALGFGDAFFVRN